MEKWDSKQYLKFEQERTQPAVDLAKRIRLSHPAKIIDIGCGPGNSTHVLKNYFPESDILGIDNSNNMIKAASEQYKDLRFMQCNAEKELGTFKSEFDIVFSNACIQWIPDHQNLLGNMFALLKFHGIMAIQTPMNYEEPIHKIITEVTTGNEWRDKFPAQRIFYNLTPGEYFDLFSEFPCTFTLWQTTYYHVLPSHEAIMEWYKGTGLRPYLSVLSEEDKKNFMQCIFNRIVQAYPKQKNGMVIFKFPRFFMLVEKE